MRTATVSFSISGQAFAGYTLPALRHVRALAEEQMTWSPAADGAKLLQDTIDATTAEIARRGAPDRF